MSFFAGHKLIKEDDGYVVLLYLEISPEFAEPFGKISREKDRDLRRQVEQYLAANFPDLKIKFAYLLIGSLLVASFSFLSAKAATNAEVDPIALTPPASAPLTETDDKGETSDSGIQPGAAAGEKPSEPELGNSNAYPSNNNPDYQGVLKPSQGGALMEEAGKEIKSMQEAFVKLGFGLKLSGVYDASTAEIIETLLERYPEYKTPGFQLLKIRALLQQLDQKNYRLAANPQAVLVLVNKSNTLAEDYVPPDLVVPKVRFSFAGEDPKQMLRLEAAEALEDLFKQAEREHLILLGASGYRSYERQAQIFSRNYQERGAAANRSSARPGESEHQTGLAMDVTCAAVGNQLTESFGETREGRWLSQRASEFGFIIRFPRGKEEITGYQYEPWHLRYVGRTAAQEITKNKWTLEEYWQHNQTKLKK